jgi:hypothetical protein
MLQCLRQVKEREWTTDCSVKRIEGKEDRRGGRWGREGWVNAAYDSCIDLSKHGMQAVLQSINQSIAEQGRGKPSVAAWGDDGREERFGM